MGKVVRLICILLALSLLSLAIAGCFTETLTLGVRQPLDGQVVGEPTVRVNGSASDPKATVTVNGIEAPVGEYGNFEMHVDLTEGENTITTVATRGSETVTETITVTYTPGK
jgi:hypothetical protein